MERGVADSERGPTTHVLGDVVCRRVPPSSISNHPEFLYPSIYDLAAIDQYIPCVCLYRLDTTDPSAFSSFVHGVKTSLSQVLSLYYPMAGKWIPTEDSWIRKLICNDEGAVFVETALDVELDQILDSEGLKLPTELSGEHAIPGFDAQAIHKTSSTTNEYPALIVQVARLKCGGVALTVNFNHMTVDGFAFNRFLQAWSDIASTGQTSAKPVFDRSVAASHFDKAHILGIQPDTKNLGDQLAAHFRFSPGGVPFPIYIDKLFGVKKSVIETLKQTSPEGFTTFECVTAQLWRCMARVPQCVPGMSGQDIVSVFFTVETRKRCSEPGLSEDYFGNMILLVGPPGLPASEITDKPFSFSASHVHESVASVKPQIYEMIEDGVLNFLVQRAAAATDEFEQIHQNKLQTSTLPVFVNAWSRFDSFYNLDFGYGKPFQFFPYSVGDPPGAAGIVILPPAPNTTNVVELLIHTPPEILKILQEDPEFINLVS